MKKIIILSLVLFLIPLVQAVNMTSGVINLTAIDSWITFSSSVYFDKAIIRDDVAEFYNISRTADMAVTTDCNFSTSNSRATSLTLLDHCFPAAEEGVSGGSGFASKTAVSVGKKEAEVNDTCLGNASFINRVLFSTCRIPDNGICDDGEWFLVDEDCTIEQKDLKTGEIFLNIWLIRVVAFLAIYLYFKKNPNFQLVVLILIVLLILNGAFGTFQTPQAPDLSFVKRGLSGQWGTLSNIEKFLVVTVGIIILISFKTLLYFKPRKKRR